MVRTSMRQQVINKVDELSLVLIKHYYRSNLWGIRSHRSEELLHRCRKLRVKLRNQRYLFRRTTYRKKDAKFHLYLDADHELGLNEREFLFHFRVTRECFVQLVHLLKDHPVFAKNNPDSRGSVPRPAEEQLLVLLKYYGSDGTGSSAFQLSAFFGISTGATESCRSSTLEALLTLETRTFFWPPLRKGSKHHFASKRITCFQTAWA